MLTAVNLLAVGLGGALGAILRWLLGLWLTHPGSALPWGTLAVNLGGGYLIGLALGLLSLYPDTPVWLRLALVTGFLGGLTTFSTFSAETMGMLERGEYLAGLGYAAISLCGGLALTALGYVSVRWPGLGH